TERFLVVECEPKAEGRAKQDDLRMRRRSGRVVPISARVEREPLRVEAKKIETVAEPRRFRNRGIRNDRVRLSQRQAPVRGRTDIAARPPAVAWKERDQ